MYPVGSIYISLNNVNPSTFIGGTWEAFARGRTLIGVDPNDSDFSTSGKTGGSKTVTLNESQLPPLSGAMQCLVPDSFYTEGIISGMSWHHSKRQAVNDSSQETQYGFRIAFGGGKAHENMPPYISTFMWKRTG